MEPQTDTDVVAPKEETATEKAVEQEAVEPAAVAQEAAAPEAPAPAAAAAEPEVPEVPKVHNYIVSTRTDREVIEGRQAAVNQAKAMTVDGASVQVEREDGRVRMQFRDGSLVEYVYETRKGPHRLIARWADSNCPKSKGQTRL